MKKIPIIKPKIDVKNLKKSLDKIAKSGVLTKGEFLVDFQNKLNSYLKVKHVYAVTSCTTALHLSLAVLDIKPGDEVLVSDFSFPASGNVIAQIGAKPVFVDIDLDTFNIDLEDLQSRITSKSKAIMVVHAFGYPANMSEIMKIAKKHHLLVIEDAACAIGSKHKDKFCGTWGDVGCFSFHPRKVITTGEGGAIVTNNQKIADKIEILRNHGGIQGKDGTEFIEIGYNYRMSELQAALGVSQMENIDEIIKKRQILAQKFLRKIKDIKKIKIIDEKKEKNFNFQSLVILLDKTINRDKLIRYLVNNGIESTLGTYAMHAQQSFAKFGYRPGDLKNSYLAYKQTLTLPLYDGLSEKQQNYIVHYLKRFIYG